MGQFSLCTLSSTTQKEPSHCVQEVARLIVSCEYEDGIEPLRSVALVHTLSRNDDGSVNRFSPSDATRAAALLPVADGEPQGSARQRLFCFILLKLNMTQVLQSGSENRPLIQRQGKNYKI
jgi:hypothetical protein